MTGQQLALAWTDPGDAIHPLAPGAVLLRAFALSDVTGVLAAVADVVAAAPFRHMQTPGGFRMSVGMTSCGLLGWIADQAGYRYSRIDPTTGVRWPTLPGALSQLATRAAERASYPGFLPDACLINRYSAGARMTLHQDKNEPDHRAPIVSVSLGLPATFLLGGANRADKAHRVHLCHGDVVVWGGAARHFYHGILPLKTGYHPATGDCRINLTFRKAAR